MFNATSFRRLAATAVAAAMFAAIAGAAQAAPGDNLIASAVSKLTTQELSALLSTSVAVAEASMDGTDTSGGPSIDDVLQVHLRIMERIKGPLKFIAADGTEFDCYGDYVEYQWGGYGLPCY